MSSLSYAIEDDIYRYLIDNSVREPNVLAELRQETLKLPNHNMQISPEHGQFMGLLVRATGAKRAVEVGTYTGYSSIAVAQALPSDGKLICCDISKDYTDIARKYWKKAGVEQKVELRLGPGVQTLDGLIKEGKSGTIDFSFIDADKPGYDNYYERLLTLTRPGGLILLDNIFQGGRILEASSTREGTVAMQALNKKLHADERVHLSMLPIGDGVTLCLKK
jgi:predicted O-methyltransferase YrrM